MLDLNLTVPSVPVSNVLFGMPMQDNVDETGVIDILDSQYVSAL